MSLWQRVQRRIGDLAGELVLDEYRDQLNHAHQLLVAGDTTAAIDVLEALLVAKPDHGQALILLGEARLVAKDPERAREAFERAIKLRTGDPEALVGHGTALVQLAKYESAIQTLGRAVAESSGDRGVLADAYRGLGIAWRRRGDLDKAIRELRKAVTENGDDPETRASLGEAIVADGGSLDEARRHLERAAKEKAPPALALYGLALLALTEDSPAIARENLAKARTIAEQDPTPLGKQRRLDIVIAQGDAALADRDAMAAHSFFLEGLQENPKLALVHARVAAAHRMIGNLDAALASYDRALALGAGNEVMRAAIDTAIAADDATRAQQWGNDLLGQDPHDVRAIVARGVAMMLTRPDAARAMLEIAAARDDVDAHVALAKLALPADPAKAATSALAALRVDPHNARARSLLTDARAKHIGAPSNDIADIARFVERVFESRRELGHFVGEVARSAANLDQPLLVTVMGEFKSGKSSFVNAFIGAEVAPTGITPTTATINVVRYGRERAGRIYLHDGTCTELGWTEMIEYLQKLSAEDSRTIDRVEMLVPLPQLEKINIVDTPGLNSILPEHEATALGFIAKADAIVWVFSAGQTGKASEKKALLQIREEGKRVLGVLNKADQLSESDLAEVLAFVGTEIGDLVETVIPFSARKALAWKKTEQGEDGNWGKLNGALEERFFQQARQLKRDGCARVLRGVIGDAQRSIDAMRQRSADASEAARAGRDALLASSRQFTQNAVLTERKALSDLTSTLYRRAAREVLDLVRPRRLPFSSHSATAADRDYLIALLQSGFESAIESGRRRVADDLLARSRDAEVAARTLGASLDTDVVGDLQRAADDRIGLALSRVFDRARAYLRGYLEGGYVEAFFRNDVPRLELAEDSVYHALVRAAPDLDREIGEPLARAATDALAALAKRLEHWGAVADVHAFDLEVGIGRALEIAASRVSQ